MILSVDRAGSKEGKVSAVVPRSVDDANFRYMVLKYHIQDA